MDDKQPIPNEVMQLHLARFCLSFAAGFLLNPVGDWPKSLFMSVGFACCAVVIYFYGRWPTLWRKPD